MGAEAVRLPMVSSDGSLDFSLVAARTAFGELEGWVMSAEACGLPEHEVERQIDTRGRDVMRLMLQAHLNRRGTGRVGPALRVVRPESETIQAEARIDERKIVSIFGDVTARRSAYAALGHEAVHPLDESACLPARSFSYEVQRQVVDEAVRGPFDEVVESIAKQTGNVLSKRSTEDVVADAAEDFDAFYATRAAPPSAETGPILVGSVDCKGVPMVKPEGARHAVRLKKGEKPNKKKMATVAAVFTQRPRIRTPEQVVASLFEDAPHPTPATRPEHKRVWASIEKEKDAVIREVVAEMLSRDPDKMKRWVGLTDGERVLQKRLALAIPGLLLILDFIHALEKLWKVAYSFHAEGSDEAIAWVRERALRILRGEVSQVVKGMTQSATKQGLRGQKRKVVDDVARYFLNNKHRMHYDEYLALGLPIASGAVEGACKNLVKDRMERSGMRWQLRGAEAILRMRATKLSGDLDEYWPFHIAREQQRLHSGWTWEVVANAK